MGHGPSGVGDSSFKRIEKPSESMNKKKGNVWDTPIRTLGDLKHALVSKLGKEKGMKLYNRFIQSMAEMALITVQKASKHAQEAAKQMRSKQR